MSPRPPAEVAPHSRRVAGCGLTLSVVILLPAIAIAQTFQDRIDITGRQNLTLGSGARAWGMGGAFLARADDATAASWNPAGLSYLMLPEVSLVAAANRYELQSSNPLLTVITRDRFEGWNADFAALTWPIAVREVRGAVQLSYQRAIAFDGTRTIAERNSETLQTARTDDTRSNGGFDVVALGTGVRLLQTLRAGVTANRWLNGYGQTLTRRVLTDTKNPLREFDLEFDPTGWNFNFGLIWSPWEALNLGAVYKTPFTADVYLSRSRRDTWSGEDQPLEVTTNAFASDRVRLEFPASYGFGVSWRPRDSLTLSADVTQTRWSEARIVNYFTIDKTGPTVNGVPGVKPPPAFSGPLQYPTLLPVPATEDSGDTARIHGQHDKQEIRLGAEWMLIKGDVRIPLRAGYFNDRQILPDASGRTPRFDGLTAGAGIAFGSFVLDLAYLYEFGSYDSPLSEEQVTDSSTTRATVRTDRFFASLIYRFGRH